MPAVANVERRKESRIDREDLSIFVDRAGKGLAEISVFDISARGIGLHLTEQWKVGDTFRFRLNIPSGPIFGTACVRWVKPHHLGFRCGVSIQEISWLNGRRLYYYLYPDQEDPVKVLDRGLTTSFFLVAVLLVLDFFGLSLDRLIELAQYVLKAITR